MAELGGTHPSSTDRSVRELVEEIRRRDEEARTQVRELARLRQETLGAISQEATRMVAAARSDIRAILVNTRNGLTELVKQVEAIGGPHQIPSADAALPGETADALESTPSPDVAAGATVLDRLDEVRRSVRQMLEEARPDLESMRKQAVVLSGREAPEADARPTMTPPKPVLSEPPAPKPALSEPTPPTPLLTELPPTKRMLTEAAQTELARQESARAEPARSEPVRTEPARSEHAARAPAWDLERPAPAWDLEPRTPHSFPAVEPLAFSPAQARSVFQTRTDSSQRRGRTRVAAVGGFAGIGAAALFATGIWMRQPSKASTPNAATTFAASTSTAQADPKTVAARPAAALAAAPAGASPWSLRLETRSTVWMQTTVDGRSDAGKLLQAGERRTIEASREVLVRVGNAGAVLASVRGGEPKALGRDGEVATRRFVVNEAAPAAATTKTSPASPGEKPGVDAARGGDSVQPVQDSGGRARPPTETTTPGRSGSTPMPTSGRSAASSPTSGAAAELATAAQRWLDGYYRRDAGLMASVAMRDVKITDDRTESERLSPGLNVRRTLDRVTTQFIGDTAILSGRVTDQADVDGQSQQSLSWISLVWMRETGMWRLMDARIISDAKLANVKE